METGVYSNRQIIEAYNTGNIVIDPFNSMQVNGSSYDVRLGEYFYTIKDKSELKPAILNPYDQEHVDSHFEGPYKAKMLRDVLNNLGIRKPKNIELEDQVIILQPGQRILGHTEEFIGIKNGTTSMQARSTSGRLGINVCQDAGWGDPGYINRWTMEIYNNNSLDPIILVVGTRVGQIVFMHTGIVDGEYSNLSGNYQSSSSSDLETIKKLWHPTQMKPKALTLK